MYIVLFTVVGIFATHKSACSGGERQPAVFTMNTAALIGMAADDRQKSKIGGKDAKTKLQYIMYNDRRANSLFGRSILFRYGPHKEDRAIYDVDERGVVHYSTKTPINAQGEATNTGTPPSIDTDPFELTPLATKKISNERDRKKIILTPPNSSSSNQSAQANQPHPSTQTTITPTDGGPFEQSSHRSQELPIDPNAHPAEQLKPGIKTDPTGPDQANNIDNTPPKHKPLLPSDTNQTKRLIQPAIIAIGAIVIGMSIGYGVYRWIKKNNSCKPTAPASDLQ